MRDTRSFDDLVFSWGIQFPVALLPARIETRFDVGAKILRIRIYPDEICADTHEELLTEPEAQAGEAYWRTLWKSNKAEDEQAAWRMLVKRLGAQRAAWVVLQTRPKNLAERPKGRPDIPPLTMKEQSWTRGAEANVLPDRWIALGYRPGKKTPVRVESNPVNRPLVLTLSPNKDQHRTDISNGLMIDDDILWTVDYNAALEAGMAIDLPLEAVDLTDGFERLIVIGAAGLEAEDGQKHLEELFNAHHYSRGVEFLRQGTPTNNTQSGSSGFPPPDPDANVSFAVEQRGLTVSGRDGDRFVKALGLGSKIVEHVAGADRDEYSNAGAMAGALWPVTFGNFIRQMMAPAFDNQDFEIESARRYFIEHIKARGPYPAFRVGAVPYGLLPVTSLNHFIYSQFVASQFERELPKALKNLLPVWLEGAKRAPRVGQLDDPDSDLLSILGMDASTREVRVRSALGPSFMLKIIDHTTREWANLYQQLSQAARIYEQLGKDPKTDTKWMRARANWFSYLMVSDRFGGPLVTAKLSETDPLDPNYIKWIREASIDTLRNQDFGGSQPPGALLYMLLRHATLLEYVRLAYDFLIANGKVPYYERYEREFSNLIDLPPWDDVWKHLSTDYKALTNNLPLGAFLFSDGAPAQVKSAIRNYRASLEALEVLSTAELERLFTETLDVCSHRIDAWVTSLAKKRIEENRRTDPTGCYLAAFGWVENLRPSSENSFSGGYIHSPSMTHAAAAAVLRNAYLTRGGVSRTEYAIDLSSSRVRTARWLLDSVRNGQPLGAVLGYQVERGLHEKKIEKYIAPLRKFYPLVANKGADSGEPAEAVAARNVVDGLSLRKAWRENSIPYGTAGLPARNDKPFQAELQRLDDAVDAVADLLTAESVYQMVRGNTAGSTATLDAMAQGLRPPDPEIVRTPKSGLSLTHRVLLILGANPVSLPEKWRRIPLTPRASAEPCLDAWAGSVIGDPEQVRCRVSVPDPAPAEPQRRREILVTLADLNLRPLDVLALAKTSAAGDEDSELDRRVAAAALRGSAPSDVRIIYAAASNWERKTVRTFPEVIELAGAINSVVSGARPLKPEDLAAPERGSGGAIDGADAAHRANDAVGALRAVRDRLDTALKSGSSSLDQPLTEASLFGVQGAFPPAGISSRASLTASATTVLAECNRRLAKAGPDPIKQEDPAAARLALQAIFGEGFVLLPKVTGPSPSELEDAMIHSPTTKPKPKIAAVESWLQQAAAVRAPLARWRRLRLYAEAIGVSYRNPDLAQLPYREKEAGAPWVGISLPDSSFAGKISLVLYRLSKPGSGEKWAGLLLDEWTEIIPLRDQATAVAFHYDNPGAEAPQAILLAAFPRPNEPSLAPSDLSAAHGRWNFEILIDIVNETFDLARARAVDGDLLGALAALRPPILLADSSVDPSIAPTVTTTFAGKLISDPVIG